MYSITNRNRMSRTQEESLSTRLPRENLTGIFLTSFDPPLLY